MRHPSLRLRHGLLIAALLCALFVRVAVPAGWMPVAGATGVTLAPCTGMGVADVAPHVMPGMAMPATDQPERHPDPAGDHPCAGAGLSVAVELPDSSLLSAPTVRPDTPATPPLFALTGLGLAAPPPPQTGPPILV